MKNIKIVILGLNFGRTIAEEIYNGVENIELYGVCDIDKEKAHGYAAKYNVKEFHSIEEVLADDNVTAVGVFT